MAALAKPRKGGHNRAFRAADRADRMVIDGHDYPVRQQRLHLAKQGSRLQHPPTKSAKAAVSRRHIGGHRRRQAAKARLSARASEPS